MIKLTAEMMLYGGFALARTEQGVVFVEGLLPTETAVCEVVGKKGGIPYYRAIEVLETSSERRKPFCKYNDACGGCNWQHINYPMQVLSKRSIFIDALTRIGKIEDIPEIEIFSADEKGYRQRVQFKIDKESGDVGFFKSGSNDVIAIDHCPLLTDNLNSLLAESKTIATVAKDNKRGFMAIDVSEGIVSQPPIQGRTNENGSIQVGDFIFDIEGSSFFQSNRFLTEKMARWCSDVFKGENLLDLYGGVGLFSLFHGQNFSSTLLVELSKSMAKKAKLGFIKNGFTSGSTLGIKSEQFFRQKQKKKFDGIIVDPPRTGLSREVREGVVNLNPKMILYISCNPTTQARDVGFWVNKKGYKIIRSAIFDLYPNSSHIESGLLLAKE